MQPCPTFDGERCRIGVLKQSELNALSSMFRKGRLPSTIRVVGRLVDENKTLMVRYPVQVIMPLGQMLTTETDAKGLFTLDIGFASVSAKTALAATAKLGVLSGSRRENSFVMMLGLR